MSDLYDNQELLEKIADWSETRGARELGYKLGKGLGALAVAISVPLAIKGVWDHDFNEIVLGVSGSLNGNFVASLAHAGLQRVRSEQFPTANLE